jgi:hypothetical protein
MKSKQPVPELHREGDIDVAATAVTVGRDGALVPRGVTHLADEEWNLLCGAGRAAYRFPGTDVSAYAQPCSECATAAADATPGAIAG